MLTEKRPEFSLLETILWSPEDGYFLLDYHLKRLTESADYFGFVVQAAEIRRKLLDLESSFEKYSHRVRLLVNAKGDPRIEVSKLPEIPARPVRIQLAHEAVQTSDVFLYHKTTYRAAYDRAMQSCPDCEDVLLWNERGEITESSIANVVVEIEGKLVTPPVHSGLLAGTFRASLLDQGKIREQVVMIDDLSRYSKIYLVNSVRRWREAVINH